MQPHAGPFQSLGPKFTDAIISPHTRQEDSVKREHRRIGSTNMDWFGVAYATAFAQLVLPGLRAGLPPPINSRSLLAFCYHADAITNAHFLRVPLIRIAVCFVARDFGFGILW